MRSNSGRVIPRLILSVVLGAISVFDFLETPVTWLSSRLQLVGLHDRDWARVLLVAVAALLVYLGLVLLDAITGRSRPSLVDSIKTAPIVTIAADGSHERIGDFRKLRAEALTSVYVMGVGATYFSSDTTLLRDLLARNLKVRVLVMSPSVVRPPGRPKKQPTNDQVRMVADAFDQFFARPQYHLEVSSSYDRLVSIGGETRSGETQGLLEIRAYPYFLPFNFTAIDESGDGRVLLEFCIPFSDQRLRMLFTAKDHADAYERIIDCAEELWRRSKSVKEGMGVLRDLPPDSQAAD
jgi:hypothetical protein